MRKTLAPPKQKCAPAKSALQKLTGQVTLTAYAGESNRRLLSWWRVRLGVCRIQTTSPGFARKLSQRSSARLVAWSVWGGYLRVFEERIRPWCAMSLVKRYLGPTNGTFFTDGSPQFAQEAGGRVRTAGESGTGR
jgi:hypothetical protein